MTIHIGKHRQSQKIFFSLDAYPQRADAIQLVIYHEIFNHKLNSCEIILYIYINITNVSYIRSIIYIILFIYISIYCHGLVLESKPFMTHFTSRSGPAVPAVLAVDFAEEAKHRVTGCKG